MFLRGRDTPKLGLPHSSELAILALSPGFKELCSGWETGKSMQHRETAEAGRQKKKVGGGKAGNTLQRREIKEGRGEIGTEREDTWGSGGWQGGEEGEEAGVQERAWEREVTGQELYLEGASS